MNNQKVAYLRVSTKEQNINRQMQQLKELGYNIDKFIIEYESGKNINKELDNAINNDLKENDELIVLSIDRLGRSLINNLQIIEDLKSKGIRFRSIKENLIIDRKDKNPMNDIYLGIMSVIGQAERVSIINRVTEGMATPQAKENMAKRPASINKAKRLKNKEYIKELNKTITRLKMQLVANKYKISIMTAYKDKKEIKGL